ncbi:MAG: 2-dehydropantoate 2-reductase [Bdellovibrionales bacterium]|nr:2-dehydropantoate 2-reductase [Bdellovibrionales bacterium]
MRIAVIGVGGVGGYFGGLLARHGLDVTFVARGEQFAALQHSGLTVRSVAGDFTLPAVSVVESVRQLEAPDLVLVATKAYDCEEVCRQLVDVIAESTIVIPIQNGIDNDRKVKEHLSIGQVFPGLAYIISTRTGPGVIEQTAGPRTLLFGDRDNPTNPRLKEIEAVMRGAGILATASSDIELELWTKFLWITTFAGMTALCRCPIGVIVNDEEAFAWYVRCLDEGISVAEASGISLGDEPRAKIIEKSEHYKHTGSHAKSSMLVDLENGRRTEIEALNGTIVRLAEEHGLSVPVHQAIYHAVRLSSSHYLDTSES